MLRRGFAERGIPQDPEDDPRCIVWVIHDDFPSSVDDDSGCESVYYTMRQVSWAHVPSFVLGRFSESLSFSGGMIEAVALGLQLRV